MRYTHGMMRGTVSDFRSCSGYSGATVTDFHRSSCARGRRNISEKGSSERRLPEELIGLVDYRPDNDLGLVSGHGHDFLNFSAEDGAYETCVHS